MKILVMTCMILLMLSNSISAQDLYGVTQHLWKPQKDNVYLQEVSEKIPTDSPVLSVAQHEGICYAIIDEHIYVIEGGQVNKMKSGLAGIQRLISMDGSLWALTSNGIHRLKEKKWRKIDDQEFVDLTMHHGVLHGATQEEIYRLENDRFVSIKPEDSTQIHADPVKLGPLTRIASYSGTLYVLQPGKLILFDGVIAKNDFIDWGLLPSKNTKDMLSFGSRMFISTDQGLTVLRGAALTTLKGKDGLPVENTTCLEQGFDGDIWIGTTKGAVRMLDNDWHYFGADHWLPGDNVHDIAVGDNVVYIATDGGMGIIRYEPYTLHKKADYYERHIEEWGHKRLGFIHTLKMKGEEWIRSITDNDGGHTATYLAAMCYKYAVTGDESDRQEAVESFKAMLWLDRITPIDGLIARSIWSTTADKDEKDRQGSGGFQAKWYPTPDGKWYWKGDTSSDEVTAAFYSASLFHDLVAEGKEKEIAKEHLAHIASYIMDNGWVIVDMDGKTTRWGRWNPEYVVRSYGNSGIYINGLNCLEVLTFMQTAYSITGDKKYETGYQQLIDWDYHTHTLRQKRVSPKKNMAPWDDNLAFECYCTILRYADNTSLRSVYLRSLERTWEVKRMENVPWFNFVYGALTGNDCELDQSVKHLREWTLDCVEHNYRNSHRDDLSVEPGYTSYEGGLKSMSPRETSVLRGSRYATLLDGGFSGQRVMEPTGFLRDYWMGRYHGFIEAPTTDDPDLISVKPRAGKQFGAKPYDGPGRPEFY